MTEGESLWAHLPSRRGFVLPCMASSEFGWQEEGEEEGEFDCGPGVVVAAQLARQRAQNG